MAIQNASDLLVYAKTANPVAQITRIRVLTTNPIDTTGSVKINNITNDGGLVSDDISTAAAANTGTAVLSAINTILTDAAYDYISSAEQTDGDYLYRDFTNGANGIVPTLEIVSGTATLNDGAIIIEIVTPGSSAIFDPVAFSTSASFSTNIDTIDCTNKDSGGYAQYKAGLKSFEISTEVLQSVNPDVPLDGTDFFHELSERDEVNVAFSDRIRNIILTNLTQSGVDGFLLQLATQTLSQTDPDGGTTASKIIVANDTLNFNRLQYSVAAGRLEDKTLTWTLYVKADTSDSVTLYVDKSGGTLLSVSKIEVLEGTFTTITNNRTINGLSSSEFTRIRLTYENLDASSASQVNFMLFPGDNPSSQSIGDSVITASWQIEFSPEATNYQDPTKITHWQGNAFVTSVSFDAGVEDNLTCSATFTGTGVTTLNQ